MADLDAETRRGLRRLRSEKVRKRVELFDASVASDLLARVREVVGAEPHPKMVPLTLRQQQLLALYAEGADVRQVPLVLDVSYGVVRADTHAILAKLGAVNRTHAVAIM